MNIYLKFLIINKMGSCLSTVEYCCDNNTILYDCIKDNHYCCDNRKELYIYQSQCIPEYSQRPPPYNPEYTLK